MERHVVPGADHRRPRGEADRARISEGDGLTKAVQRARDAVASMRRRSRREPPSGALGRGAARPRGRRDQRRPGACCSKAAELALGRASHDATLGAIEASLAFVEAETGNRDAAMLLCESALEPRPRRETRGALTAQRALLAMLAGRTRGGDGRARRRDREAVRLPARSAGRTATAAPAPPAARAPRARRRLRARPSLLYREGRPSRRRWRAQPRLRGVAGRRPRGRAGGHGRGARRPRPAQPGGRASATRTGPRC